MLSRRICGKFWMGECTILAILLTALLFVASGCIAWHGDGVLPRTVLVSVEDKDTGQAIRGANVRLIPLEGIKRGVEQNKYEHLYEQMTDARGVAKLLAWFGFGSEEAIWRREGDFSLASVRSVQVSADGYVTSEQDFVSLAGEHSRSINDKSAIKVTVMLKRSDFKAEYSDAEKYVKLKWHAGMPYDRTCELITKDKLPRLNEMLNDQEYAPYWHNIARVIGYISDDPNSVPILLNYFKRDDGVNVSSLVGKIWSIAFIGKIGGEQADEILKNAVTEDGAIEIASNWINQELWPDKTWDKSEVIEYIRNAAMIGLVLTRKSDNLDIVKNIYEDAYNRVVKTKKWTRLCAYAIDSMAANDFIAEHGMEEYLNLTGGEEIRSLTPYSMKYSPPPPQN
jgi:hypothetical protein